VLQAGRGNLLGVAASQFTAHKRPAKGDPEENKPRPCWPVDERKRPLESWGPHIKKHSLFSPGEVPARGQSPRKKGKTESHFDFKPKKPTTQKKPPPPPPKTQNPPPPHKPPPQPHPPRDTPPPPAPKNQPPNQPREKRGPLGVPLQAGRTAVVHPYQRRPSGSFLASS